MTVAAHELDAWLQGREDEHLEVKEAKARFDFEKLVKYRAALANEGGGAIVLGVTDKRPRRVVGTRAFENPERTKAGLVEKLRLCLDVDESSMADAGSWSSECPRAPWASRSP